MHTDHACPPCRYRITHAPKAEEDALLACIDYAACKNQNGGYRPLVLQDAGRCCMEEWPVLDEGQLWEMKRR